MLIDIDLKKEKVTPKLYLALPSRKIVGVLKEVSISSNKIRVNQVSELTFSVPYEIEINFKQQLNPHIDYLKSKFLIKLVRGDYVEWYQIDKTQDVMRSNDEFKEIQCFSLAYEMNNKQIRSYTGEAKNAEQVLYELTTSTYGVSDINKALWKYDYINPEFNKMYRTFNITSKSLLGVLLSDIKDTFDCIVTFDTINRTYSLYKIEELISNKGLSFNYGKYLESVDKELDTAEFCTQLNCYGKDGLTISEVNPLGNPSIFDYSYYLYPYEEDENGNIINHSNYMTDSLAGALLDYNKLVKSKDKIEAVAESGTIENIIKLPGHGLINGDYVVNRTRGNAYREVTVQNADTILVSTVVEQTAGDTIYMYKNGTFGKLLYAKRALEERLTNLQNELFSLELQLNMILDKYAVVEETGGNLNQLKNSRDYKQAQVNEKKLEISNIEGLIFDKENEILDLQSQLSYETNFTHSQILELQQFTIDQTWEDQNYIDVYDLYYDGIKKMSEINVPILNIKLGVVNFMDCIECQHDWNKLILCDKVNMKYEKLGIDHNANITEIDFKDDSGDIDIVIGDIKYNDTNKDKVLQLLDYSVYASNKLNQESVNWNNMAQNFDKRNDRNKTIPENPLIAEDGTAIDHTLNTDGSANISFEWNYDGTGDAYNIDGFEVRVRSTMSHEPYLFGSGIAEEQTYYMDAFKRAIVLKGQPADQYYTFGIRAYRRVDADINAGGILYSSTMKSFAEGENPYHPEDNIAFNGDISGTINGVQATIITNAVSNFNDRNDRIFIPPAAPVVPGYGVAIDHTLNTDGSANISFEWNYDGTGDAYNIDGFIVYMYSRDSSASYAFGTSPNEEQLSILTADKRSHIISGVPANKYYTFGVQAYRAVDQDISASGALYSTIVKSTYSMEDPYQPAINVAFEGDITGTISGKPVGEVIDFIDETEDFLDVTYPEDMYDIQEQIDGKITTWYYDYDPTPYNLPALEWQTQYLKEKHNGDLFYNYDEGKAFRFTYVGGQFLWEEILDGKVIEALNTANEAQYTADRKRAVFLITPYVPYDIGDLWREAGATDFKICIKARSEHETYVSSDWVVATTIKEYVDTEITELNNAMDALEEQIGQASFDGQLTIIEANSIQLALEQVLAESEDIINVANSLGITAEKNLYVNNLYFLEYHLNQNWLGQPEYPIEITDTQRDSILYYFNEVESAKSKLNNKIIEEQSKSSATEILNDYINIVTDSLNDLQNQIDGKITTWFQENDPNTWIVADRSKHNGDLWYKASVKELKRYNSSSNTWQTIEDQAAIDAYNLASQAQDTADGKRTVFVTTPYPPYDVGDLWTQDSNSIIKVCVVAKAIGGSFSESDWRLATEDVRNDGKLVNDENVTAYFPFNDNLFDSRGVFEATFTRTSSASLADGTQLSDNLPRFEKAKFDNGILMEDTNVNLVTDGDCELDVPKIGGTFSLNSLTPVLDTTQKHSNKKSLRLATIGTGVSDRYFQIGNSNTMNGLIAGQTYTCSAWVYVPSSSGIALNSVCVRAYRAYPSGGGYKPSTFPNKYDTWQRIVVTWESDINDTAMYFRFLINQDVANAIMYWDDIQVEQKPFATSFVPSNRAFEVLNIPTNNIIQKNSFSVDIIYTPIVNNNLITRSYSKLWDMRINSNNYYGLWHTKSQLLFYICSGGSITTIGYKTISLLAGFSYTITISVGVSTASLFLNGELIGTNSYTPPIGNLPSSMYIGNGANYISAPYPINGTIDELRFSKVARTLEEHQAYYNSGKSFTDGETIVRTDTKYNHVAINPLDGIKCTHEDGSYTQMRAEGFKRFVPKSVYTERALGTPNRYTFSTGVLEDYFTVYGGTAYTRISNLPTDYDYTKPPDFPSDITKGIEFDEDDTFVRLSTVKNISKDCVGHFWYMKWGGVNDTAKLYFLANGRELAYVNFKKSDDEAYTWIKKTIEFKKGLNLIDIIHNGYGDDIMITDIMFESDPVEHVYAGKSSEIGTEYLYLTYVGNIYCDYSYAGGSSGSSGGGGLIDIPIQLPEEFKNKDFKIVFAASDMYSGMGGGANFGVWETDRDVANAIVYVNAFAQRSDYTDGIGFSYFVIA